MKQAAKILVVAGIAGLAFYINKSGLFQRTLEWIDQLGPSAPVVFILIYTLTSIFFVPSFFFTFGAGAIFGLWKGLLLALLGTGTGALAAFLLGRYMARDLVGRSFAKNKEFRQMDEAVKVKGWKIVALARLSPVFPFLVGNYAFGLTKIPAFHYFVASIIGTIPSAAVYVYAGTVAGEIAQSGSGSRGRTPAEWALLVGGLIATGILTWYIRRVAKEALVKNLGPQPGAAGQAGSKNE